MVKAELLFLLYKYSCSFTVVVCGEQNISTKELELQVFGPSEPESLEKNTRSRSHLGLGKKIRIWSQSRLENKSWAGAPKKYVEMGEGGDAF